MRQVRRVLLFGLDDVPHWATRAAAAALVGGTLWTGWRVVRRNLI